MFSIFNSFKGPVGPLGPPGFLGVPGTKVQNNSEISYDFYQVISSLLAFTYCCTACISFDFLAKYIKFFQGPEGDPGRQGPKGESGGPVRFLLSILSVNDTIRYR